MSSYTISKYNTNDYLYKKTYNRLECEKNKAINGLKE